MSETVEEQMKMEQYLESKGIEKQECPDCGKKSYTGLHLCTANLQQTPNDDE